MQLIWKQQHHILKNAALKSSLISRCKRRYQSNNVLLYVCQIIKREYECFMSKLKSSVINQATTNGKFLNVILSLSCANIHDCKVLFNLQSIWIVSSHEAFNLMKLKETKTKSFQLCIQAAIQHYLMMQIHFLGWRRKSQHIMYTKWRR